MLFKFVFDIFLTFCMSCFFILFWGFFKVNSGVFFITERQHWLFQFRFARLAVLQSNFLNFAIFQVGWPYDFWVGHLAFFGRFLRLFGQNFFLLAVLENM